MDLQVVLAWAAIGFAGLAVGTVLFWLAYMLVIGIFGRRK